MHLTCHLFNVALDRLLVPTSTYQYLLSTISAHVSTTSTTPPPTRPIHWYGTYHGSRGARSADPLQHPLQSRWMDTQAIGSRETASTYVLGNPTYRPDRLLTSLARPSTVLRQYVPHTIVTGVSSSVPPADWTGMASTRQMVILQTTNVQVVLYPVVLLHRREAREAGARTPLYVHLSSAGLASLYVF